MKIGMQHRLTDHTFDQLTSGDFIIVVHPDGRSAATVSACADIPQFEGG